MGAVLAKNVWCRRSRDFWWSCYCDYFETYELALDAGIACACDMIKMGKLKIRTMQKNNKATQFKSIANGLADLYERKNSDYGDSFGRSYEKYGSISSLTRISDKFNRLESLMLGKEQKVQDEKVEDTLADMASYCIMTIMEMKK